MAASVAAQEARGFRKVPTLSLTPGVGMEAAGLVELEEEEEEEEEEEAAARRARSFVQDARVRFVGGRLEQMLGFPEEKWSQHLESEDNRQILGEFLESPGPACLVFSIAAAGQLATSHQVRGDGQGDLTMPPAQPDSHPGRNRPFAPPWFFSGYAFGCFKKLLSSTCPARKSA